MSRTVEEVQADLRAFASGEVKPTFDRWNETLNALIQELTDLLPSQDDETLQKLATGETAPPLEWAVIEELIRVNENLFAGIEAALAKAAALAPECALLDWVGQEVKKVIEDEAARDAVLGLVLQLRLGRKEAAR
jgi:hypothetical protein